MIKKGTLCFKKKFGKEGISRDLGFFPCLYIVHLLTFCNKKGILSLNKILGKKGISRDLGFFVCVCLSILFI